jgi:Leucine-rich repeat (LRR) protein
MKTLKFNLLFFLISIFILSFVKTINSNASSRYLFGLTNETKQETIKKAKEIVSSLITEDMSNREKAMILNEYIGKNVSYDYDHYREIKRNKNASNAYGAIIEGKVTCKGYSYAYSLLLSLAGVPNLNLSGDVLIDDNEPEGHAWNLVYMDQKWLHVDPTWSNGDPTRYFGLTDEEMEKFSKRKYENSSNEDKNIAINNAKFFSSNIDESIKIPDQNLEKALRETLNISNNDTIKMIDLGLVEHISLNHSQIEDISALSILINLTVLNLNYNKIKDISPLGTLHNLRYISLNNNKIKDISPLKMLINLKKIHLRSNQIEDISPLSTLHNLTYIELNDNQIKDISPLVTLHNLTDINLNNNQIKDISALMFLTNLRTVNLSDNKIEDISPLIALNKLFLLNISNSQLKDISPLGTLHNLIYLGLSNNQIKDVSPLGKLIKLTHINLDNNQIEDVSPLITLNNLSSLNLSNNQIKDISTLFDNDGLILFREIDRYPDLILQFNFLREQVDKYQEILNERFKNKDNEVFRFGPQKKSTQIISKEESMKVVNFEDINLEKAIRELIEKPNGDITKGDVFLIEGMNLSNKNISNIKGLENAFNLKHLNLSGNQIKDISPLEKLTNLTNVDLMNNQIEDISPLITLNNLSSLTLSHNQIKDLSPLGKLINLTYVQLDNNQIEDISPLITLNKLYSLNLSHNQIKDISPLGTQHDLKYLDLSHNQIEVISPLRELTNLATVVLRNNQIEDLSPLITLNNLSTLALQNNQIKDISPLFDDDGFILFREIDNHPQFYLENNFLLEQVDKYQEILNERFKTKATEVFKFGHQKKLSQMISKEESMKVVNFEDINLEKAIRELIEKPTGDITKGDVFLVEGMNLSNKNISNIKGLENAFNLKNLTLSYNQIEDISPLGKLTNLTYVFLSYNQIKDISPLETLTNLKTIFLSNNQIKDISPLGTLNNLTYIELYNNQIKDISAFGKLTNLTSVSLNNNQIKDISALGKLTNLKVAYLSNNQIKDISPLSTLYNLTRINLNNNQIKDISPLSTLHNLTSIELMNNKISDISLLFDDQGFILFREIDKNDRCFLDLRHNFIIDVDAYKNAIKAENIDHYFGAQYNISRIEIDNELQRFSDITNEYKEYSYYIKELFLKNIMTGTSVFSYRFNPDGALTRAEFTALLVKAFNLDQGQEVSHSFKDVKPEDWYDRVVGISSRTGIINGRTSEIFDPQSPITNQEMAILLTKIAEIMIGINIDIETNSLNVIDKENIKDWAMFGVDFVVKNELMDLDEQNMFNPNNKVKRYIVAKALYKTLEKRQ